MCPSVYHVYLRTVVSVS